MRESAGRTYARTMGTAPDGEDSPEPIRRLPFDEKVYDVGPGSEVGGYVSSTPSGSGVSTPRGSGSGHDGIFSAMASEIGEEPAKAMFGMAYFLIQSSPPEVVTSYIYRTYNKARLFGRTRHKRFGDRFKSGL